MSLDAERLYALLPAVQRQRDAEHGQPLRALLALFARELEALEEDIEQLYDDQFIETCEDWVAPYIGDLIGYRPLRGASPAVSSPRAEVANTIAYRRRKGTALMLEQLARDLTDWPAHVAEFFEQLATTQYMKHLRPHSLATADLRSQAAMRSLGGAFNTVAHTVEVRRPERSARGGGGRYNIPNIGIFLWRLLPLRLSGIPLVAHPGDAGGTRFRLNPLGADLALFRQPRSEDSIATLSEPVHVPAPLRVRGMAAAVRAANAPDATAEAQRRDDYGPGESLVLLRPGAQPGDWEPVPVEEIVVADLRDVDGGDWNHQDAIPAGRIAIDPERGRVVLGTGVDPQLRATFRYGFARAIGGGEYERTPEGETLAMQDTANASAALQPHLDAIRGGGRLLVEDSLTYAGPFAFRVDAPADPQDAGREVVVAAANGARPLLAAGADIELDIGARGRLVLDGLVVSGGALTLAAAADDEPRELVLRHCTLLPGLALNPDGGAASPGAPSLAVAHPFAKLTLEHCIVGALQVADGAEVEIVDSIVDAGAPTAPAYAGIAADAPGGTLTIRDSSVIGKLRAKVIELASDCIFHAARAGGDPWPAPVWAQRTQQGCVRFCWLPADSIAPRRHRCLPDADHRDARPHFASLRYGQPAYLQLRASTAAEILHGASDEGEIGVMHALSQPQREANLRIRLDEYLRYGLNAGVFHVT
ncbi:hypothetical protein GCM10027084_16550 [Pseudoxanthomonas sangjuensis]|uniref:hypothetical protein n=1 Tax=Pseudoxanthomonas sangjuensis TaxID=1503750 RepID=UPI001391AA0E|nr:hypothetical protein [Pseudoxanthomonas sangjuensis]KAF1709687.1 hypothetical protein CSC71_10610 [Pseudoxanthomonas sangjuensis]